MTDPALTPDSQGQTQISAAVLKLFDHERRIAVIESDVISGRGTIAANTDLIRNSVDAIRDMLDARMSALSEKMEAKIDAVQKDANAKYESLSKDLSNLGWKFGWAVVAVLAAVGADFLSRIIPTIH